MIRILMEADQARVADQIQVAGVTYQITGVVVDPGVVTINAARIVEAGSLVLQLPDDAHFEIIAPDQDGRS